MSPRKNGRIEDGATLQSSCQVAVLPGPQRVGPMVDNRAPPSDVGGGQQEILEDEPLFGGRLHAKGRKAVGSYWKGWMYPLT